MKFKFAMITAFMAAALSAQNQHDPTGYTDTPTIPGSKWRVHDDARPRPPVITPGTCSTRTNRVSRLPMPSCFLMGPISMRGPRSRANRPNGRSRTGIWKWLPARATSTPNSSSATASSTSNSPRLRRQRATVSHAATAASFSTVSTRCRCSTATTTSPMPMVRRRPIRTVAAAGECLASARGMANLRYRVYRAAVQGRQGGRAGYVTIFHNGVITQNHTQILGATGHRVLPKLVVHGPAGPIELQDHHNPTHFRNIWIRPLGQVQ